MIMCLLLRLCCRGVRQHLWVQCFCLQKLVSVLQPAVVVYQCLGLLACLASDLAHTGAGVTATVTLTGSQHYSVNVRPNTFSAAASELHVMAAMLVTAPT
jgi:hypothetical protein